MKTLSLGIVGLPNVGKSSLFKLLTKQEVNIANYPFATINPNVGVVSVPDKRINQLAAISRSKKIVPAVVEFYDIAGLVKGASVGQGLGNQFLAHIRATQAIIIVLRLFQSSDITHIEKTVDPIRDLEIIITELILKDLETVQKRLRSAESEARSGDKQAERNLAILRAAEKDLASGRLTQTNAETDIIRDLQLLTAKKQLYLLNGRPEEVSQGLIQKITASGADYLLLDILTAAAADTLVVKAYTILQLISFFTTGEDETRAWTIRRGTKASQAAGVIHSDFEKKFIRAEVVPYEKLIQAGGWTEAKQRGWLRLEGKDYLVQDGDVIVVRHG